MGKNGGFVARAPDGVKQPRKSLAFSQKKFGTAPLGIIILYPDFTVRTTPSQLN
jgi:hypothetical protein